MVTLFCCQVKEKGTVLWELASRLRGLLAQKNAMQQVILVEAKAYTRKYLRISPDMPLYGMASIVRADNKRVYTGASRVRIMDISPGGMRIISSLRMPVGDRLTLELSFQLDETSYCLQGFVVHCCSGEVSEYEYGFCFTEPEPRLREPLKKLFNKMSVRLNRHIVILRHD